MTAMDVFKNRAWVLGVVSGLLSLVSILPARADEEPGSQKQIGNWRLAAYRDDGSGLFSHCAINAGYPNGISVVFAFSPNASWRIAWYGNTWSMTPGKTVELRLGTDASPPKPYTGQVKDPHSVFAELPMGDDPMKQLFLSRSIILEMGGQRYDFPSGQLSKAMAAGFECVADHVTKAPPHGTPGTAGTPAQVPAPAAPATIGESHRPEARQTLSRILEAAGLSKAKILSDDEIRSANLSALRDRWHAIWRTGNLLGVIRVADAAQAGTITGLTSILAADDERNCADGRYSSDSSVEGATSKVGRLRTTCFRADGGWEARYLISPRQAGGVYVTGVTTAFRSGDFGLVDFEQPRRELETVEDRVRGALAGPN